MSEKSTGMCAYMYKTVDRESRVICPDAFDPSDWIARPNGKDGVQAQRLRVIPIHWMDIEDTPLILFQFLTECTSLYTEITLAFCIRFLQFHSRDYCLIRYMFIHVYIIYFILTKLYKLHIQIKHRYIQLDIHCLT